MKKPVLVAGPVDAQGRERKLRPALRLGSGESGAVAAVVVSVGRYSSRRRAQGDAPNLLVHRGTLLTY